MELSPEGVKQVQRMFNRLNSKIELKLPQIALRLAEIGVPIVFIHYMNGIDEGNEDYDVVIEPTEKGCKLVARGEDVCFLEFGAGVSTKSWQGEGQEGLPPIYPGSWSETEGSGQFANKGYWFYNGEMRMGLEPKKGMYYASKEMQQRATEIVRRELFND